MYGLVLFLFVASVVANERSSCPDVKAADNFNINNLLSLALATSSLVNVINTDKAMISMLISHTRVFFKFGNGIWYEVASYKKEAEEETKCRSTEYKMEGDMIKVKESNIANNKIRSFIGTAQLAEDAGSTGKLIFSYSHGAPGALNIRVSWILATEYNNYAIGYYCVFNERTMSYEDYAWIFSRSKVLEGEVRASVEKFLKESSIIDSSKLVWHDFSNETCKVDA